MQIYVSKCPLSTYLYPLASWQENSGGVNYLYLKGSNNVCRSFEANSCGSSPSSVKHETIQKPWLIMAMHRFFFLKQKKNRPGVFQANRSEGYYIAFYLCFSPSRSVFLYFLFSVIFRLLSKKKKKKHEWVRFILFMNNGKGYKSRDLRHVVDFLLHELQKQ